MDPNVCNEVEWRLGNDGLEPDFVVLSMCERRAKLAVEDLLAFQATARIIDAERRVDQAQRIYREVENRIEDADQELLDSDNGLLVASLAAEGAGTTNPELVTKAQREVLRFRHQHEVASQKRAQLEIHSNDTANDLRRAIASLEEAREYARIHKDAAEELRHHVKESQRILEEHRSHAISNPSSAGNEGNETNGTKTKPQELESSSGGNSSAHNDALGTAHGEYVSDPASVSSESAITTKNMKQNSTHETSQKDHDDALAALSAKMDNMPRMISDASTDLDDILSPAHSMNSSTASIAGPSSRPYVSKP